MCLIGCDHAMHTTHANRRPPHPRRQAPMAAAARQVIDDAESAGQTAWARGKASPVLVESMP